VREWGSESGGVGEWESGGVRGARLRHNTAVAFEVNNSYEKSE
jgi:hypothetical protein